MAPARPDYKIAIWTDEKVIPAIYARAEKVLNRFTELDYWKIMGSLDVLEPSLLSTVISKTRLGKERTDKLIDKLILYGLVRRESYRYYGTSLGNNLLKAHRSYYSDQSLNVRRIHRKWSRNARSIKS